MEIFEHIKKHSGWFIIPFTWIAYYMDYGVSHLSHGSSFKFIPENFLLAIQTIGTILMVTFVLLMFFYGLICYLATFFEKNLFFLVIAIVCLCFGTLGLFKEMDDIPLKDINLFWHLSSLSAGVWLLNVSSSQKNSTTTEKQ
jgi:hypothetical protein